MTLAPSRKHKASADTFRLRILATTDIHMELRGFDYVTDAPLSHNGLAGLATLIKRARAQARADGAASILLDNGDFLQGNALATWMSKQPVTADHALVRALNHLGYDAIGVGNHDLDHGLPYLLDVARYLKMPMIATNLQGDALKPLVQSTLLPTQGGPTIGLLSVLPEETERWNAAALTGTATVRPERDALTKTIPQLRAAGADLIIVLAHLGIAQGVEGPSEEGDALGLAEVEGVDAMIAGHTHLRFPGTDHQTRFGVDAALGTLAGRPAIMAGHAGSDLAIMDLTVKHRRGGDSWTVTSHNSALAINAPHTPPDPTILRISENAHARTCHTLMRDLATTSRALHNYFSLAAPTTTAALHAQAKINATRAVLADTPHRDLPVLATAAAHTAGGRAGAGHFLNIPKGAIKERHLVGLDPYGNAVTAVLQTGKQLRARLEQSARIYATLDPTTPDQLLKRPTIPSYDFDTLFGISYTIDPTVPFSTVAGRINDLSYAGDPIQDDQRFVLAINQFRAVGGGGFQRVPPDDILLKDPYSLHQALLELLAQPETTWRVDACPWSFSTPSPVQAILETAPDAVAHLDQIAHLNPEVLGETANGFLQLRLTL